MRERSTQIKLLQARDEWVRRRCERSYYEFFKYAWTILEPATPLKDNWHIRFLCDTLQDQVERVALRLPKDKDLIINMPPRAAKSQICTIMLTPWAWTRFPYLRFINSSHSKALSIDHCVKSRRVIESIWYQGIWGDRFEMQGDQNVKSHFENDKGGIRFAASVDGAVSGHGADIIVSDDLVDVKDAESESALNGAYEHYKNALFTRLNDQDVGLRIVVMQRVHEKDPSGMLLKDRPEDHDHICLPLEPDDNIKPKELAEYYGGTSFFPARFTDKFITTIKKMGSRAYSAQMQQKPMGASGAVFKPEWFRHWNALPEKFDEYILSWDMAFKDLKTSDFVVGQAWGRVGVECYFLDQVRGQWDFPKTVDMFLAMIQKHPRATIKVVEDKANGTGIISVLKSKISGIVPENPEGSKLARAHAVTFLFESGNVHFPPKDRCPWIQDYLDELLSFTGESGNQDDQVDATTQALKRIGLRSSLKRLKDLLEM